MYLAIKKKIRSFFPKIHVSVPIAATRQICLSVMLNGSLHVSFSHLDISITYGSASLVVSLDRVIVCCLVGNVRSKAAQWPMAVKMLVRTTDFLLSQANWINNFSLR